MKQGDVIAVLKEAGKPLSDVEIVERLQAHGMETPGGKTPHKTISAQIYMDIKRNGENSPFRKVPKKALFFVNPNYCAPKVAEKKQARKPSKSAAPQPSPKSPDRLSFTDSTEYILDKQGNRKPMHYRAITKAALASGILHTTGQTPEASLYAMVLTENKRRTEKAERPRFVCHGKGMIGLTKWEKVGPAAQIDQGNKEVKEQLLDILKKTKPKKFEELVTRVFAAMGFSDTMTTSYTKDGGVDVRGTLEVDGAIKLPVSVQVKRFKQNVQSPVIDALRGALHIGERGVVVTTSDFSSGARESASDITKAGGVVDLINGHEFVDLMVMHGVWVKRNEYNMLSITQDTEDE